MAINSIPIALNSAVVAATGLDAEVAENFKLDRYLGDTLILPYTFEDIMIKSNELCTADNINASLYKLHYNFLYLNAQAKIGDNNFPRAYKGFICSVDGSLEHGANQFIWYNSTRSASSITTSLSETGRTALSGVVAGAAVDSIDSNQHYTVFFATTKTLFGTRSTTDDVHVWKNLHKATIEDATALEFIEIRDLAVNSDKNLFVIDDNLIHKFNVDAALTSNRAVSGAGRFLIKTIGGRSRNIYDKDKFNKPVSISIGNNDQVYILDQVDRGFKIYDKDLNWKRTSARRNEFANLSGGKVTSIAVDKETDYIYVLVDNGLLFRFDDEFILQNLIKLADPIEEGETFEQIKFSRKNPDVVYVMTSKSLFKKFKTKMHKSIGAFRLKEKNLQGAGTSSAGTNTEQTMTFVDVLMTENTDYDYVFLGTNSDHTWTYSESLGDHSGTTATIGKIFKFDEQVNYKTLIYDAHKSDLYPLSAVNVNSKEFVTSWVLNKAIHKMIYNHLLFRDNIFFKYEGAYDEIGRIQLSETRHIFDTDYNLFDYTTDLNFFIGINEPVFAGTVNRPLEKVYELQKKLIEMCTESITNKFPYATQVIELK